MLCEVEQNEEDVMKPVKFDGYDVYPFQGFRFVTFEEEHGLALLQIASSTSDDVLLADVRTYVLGPEHFRMLGKACLEKAEELERGGVRGYLC
jgi:hypothetical protein